MEKEVIVVLPASYSSMLFKALEEVSKSEGGLSYSKIEWIFISSLPPGRDRIAKIIQLRSRVNLDLAEFCVKVGKKWKFASVMSGETIVSASGYSIAREGLREPSELYARQ